MKTNYFSKFQELYIKKQKIINIFFFLVWIGLIGFILLTAWKSRLQVLPYLKQADYSKIIGVLLLYLLALALAVSSWTLIINVFDRTLSWWTHIKIYLTTIVARRLPGTIWYIGGRMMLYKQLGVSQIQTATASGIELVVSFVADCLIGCVLLPFGLGLPPYWVVILACAGFAGLFILRPTSLNWVLLKLNRPLTRMIETWRIGLWLLLRLALVAVGGLMITQILFIFQPISSQDILLILGARAISGAAGMLTYFLPSSFGASDLTLIVFLNSIIPMSLATVVAIIVRLMTSFFEVLFGIIFYILLRNSKEFRNINLFITNNTND